MTRKVIYMDYAAASPLDDGVLSAMLPYFSDQFYNPSALYLEARNARSALNEARTKIAQIIGAKPSEIVFTAGGTESVNLAINGVMQDTKAGEQLIVSAIEHDAVLESAKKYHTITAEVDFEGRIDVNKFRKLITDKTRLISVMYANNEIGTIQPIKEIVKIVAQTRKDRSHRGIKTPIYVHTDAAQAPQYLDCNVSKLGVDLMSLNGGKIYGPKQAGILYVRAGVRLSPIILGGGQEMGYRSGTENVPACVGLAKALELVHENQNIHSRSVGILSKYFIEQLEKQYSAILNGHRKLRLPNNIHVTFKGTDNERVLFYLDQNGVCAATGSACSASKEQASHVLQAIGISENDSRSSIRFSIDKKTTKKEIDTVLRILKKAIVA